MKTICGQSISTKQISFSKAAKILAKFASAENGASQAIIAYLHRASSAFIELNQLHKELKLSSSHRKHKRHRTENADQDDEKSPQTVFNCSQKPNGSIVSHLGNEGGSEKHKNNKKKHQEVECRDDGDIRVEFGHMQGEVKVPITAQNEIQSSRVQGGEGEGYTRVEEGKKQKKEKKKGKKDKDGAFNFSSSKGEVENPEGESAVGSRRIETEEKLCDSVEAENGGLVDPQDLKIKKKKYEAATENQLYAAEVKMVQKKRKNEHHEDRSGYLSNKRMKTKYEGDS